MRVVVRTILVSLLWRLSLPLAMAQSWTTSEPMVATGVNEYGDKIELSCASDRFDLVLWLNLREGNRQPALPPRHQIDGFHAFADVSDNRHVLNLRNMDSPFSDHGFSVWVGDFYRLDWHRLNFVEEFRLGTVATFFAIHSENLGFVAPFAGSGPLPPGEREVGRLTFSLTGAAKAIDDAFAGCPD